MRFCPSTVSRPILRAGLSAGLASLLAAGVAVAQPMTEGPFGPIPPGDCPIEPCSPLPGEVKPAEPPESAVAPPSNPSPQPALDYGDYHKALVDLDTLRFKAEEGLSLAKALRRPLPMTELAHLSDQASQDKARFDSLFWNGQYPEALAALNTAKAAWSRMILMTLPPTLAEARAIWLDRGTIISAGTPEKLKALIQQLHTAGLNVIYFEALNAGYPMYTSAILPRNPLLAGYWDPLKVAVEEGHRLGMEVHAWVWCFAVGNTRHNELSGQSSDYAGPVLVDKGLLSEALRGATGNLIPSKGRQHEYWVSPASPKARQFLKDIYTEIVRNYAVDGLQLDYIRYPFQSRGAQMGFEPVGRQRFEADTGLSLANLDDLTLKTWAAWKSYQVSSFVREMSDTLRPLRPGLKLSAAVYPMRRADRIWGIQQDWETWLDRGWIDTLSPMTYTDSPSSFQQDMATLSRATQRPALIYPGIGLHRLDALSMVDRMGRARSYGMLGHTLFATAHLDPDKLKALSEGPYQHKPAFSPHRQTQQTLQQLLKDLKTAWAATQGQSIAAPEGAVPLETLLAELNDLTATASRLPAEASSAAWLPVVNAWRGWQPKAQPWVAAIQASHPTLAGWLQDVDQRFNRLAGYFVEPSQANLPFEPPPRVVQPPVPPTPAAAPPGATPNASAAVGKAPAGPTVPPKAAPIVTPPTTVKAPGKSASARPKAAARRKPAHATVAAAKPRAAQKPKPAAQTPAYTAEVFGIQPTAPAPQALQPVSTGTVRVPPPPLSQPRQPDPQ